MMERTSSTNQVSSLAPGTKRRKIRKGTSSCWECKRRKARCTFTGVGSNTTCDGCRRRGTQCISQDLPNEPASAGTNRRLVDRLGHVEALVGQLVKAAHSGKPSQHNRPPSDMPSSPSQHQPNETIPSQFIVAEYLRNNSVMPASALNSSTTISHPEQITSSSIERERSAHMDHPTTATTHPTAAILAARDTPSSCSKHDLLCRELLTTWPSQADFEIILSVPVETSSVVRGVTFTRPSGSTELIIPSAQTLLQLPPSGSHPVLVARKLLILVTLLQGMPSSSVAHLESLSTSHQDMMSQMVEMVHHLVTCNDDLVASVEGIECIMLEALYENYCGNFRRSWLAARRAVTIAEMLGLHRGVKARSLNGVPFKPEYMWFRLVQLDRYLSMMMGLPQTSLDESFAHPDLMEDCGGPERMHRLNCVAAGRLLRRTPAEMYDPTVTKEIDKLLEQASASLPAKWWVPPNLAACQSRMDTVRETLRFNDHFMHYHMLVQLHLPYLLHSEPGRDFQYNQMTAVTASREILSRFATFRTFHSVGYYCRGVDFLAFIASTALCLGHISDRRLREKEYSDLHFLAHQRLCDRGLLESIHESMLEIARRNNDSISTTVATLIGHLLVIEEDIATGGDYTITSFPESRKEDELGCSVSISSDGAVLDIYLPYIWAIKIERVSRKDTLLPTELDRYQTIHGYSNRMVFNGGNLRSLLPEQSVDESMGIFQDMDLSIFDSLI